MIRQVLVEQRVREALADAGQWRPPADLVRLCERAGLRLRRKADLRGGQQAHYDAERGEIAVAERWSARAERFSIAHELGHALMEHGSRECYEGERSTEATPLDETDMGVDFEREANAFADELLIPGEWLRRAVVDDELTVNELRQLFDATPEVMFIALDRHRLLYKVRTS